MHPLLESLLTETTFPLTKKQIQKIITLGFVRVSDGWDFAQRIKPSPDDVVLESALALVKVANEQEYFIRNGLPLHEFLKPQHPLFEWMEDLHKVSVCFGGAAKSWKTFYEYTTDSIVFTEPWKIPNQIPWFKETLIHEISHAVEKRLGIGIQGELQTHQVWVIKDVFLQDKYGVRKTATGFEF